MSLPCASTESLHRHLLYSSFVHVDVHVDGQMKSSEQVNSRKLSRKPSRKPSYKACKDILSIIGSQGAGKSTGMPAGERRKNVKGERRKRVPNQLSLPATHVNLVQTKQTASPSNEAVPGIGPPESRQIQTRAGRRNESKEVLMSLRILICIHCMLSR